MRSISSSVSSSARIFGSGHALGPSLSALSGSGCVSMPPLFRVDVGKQVYYALDEEEKRLLLERIEREKVRGQVHVTRFKGLGEMNPMDFLRYNFDSNGNFIFRPKNQM